MPQILQLRNPSAELELRQCAIVSIHTLTFLFRMRSTCPSFGVSAKIEITNNSPLTSNHNRKCPISTDYDCIGRVISVAAAAVVRRLWAAGPWRVGDAGDAQGTAASCRGWVLMAVQALPPWVSLMVLQSPKKSFIHSRQATHIHTHKCTHTCTHACSYMYTLTQLLMCTGTSHMHTHRYTHTRTHTSLS